MKQKAVSMSSICQTQRGVNGLDHQRGRMEDTFKPHQAFDAELCCSKKEQRGGLHNKVLCFVFSDKGESGYSQATSVHAPQLTSANFGLSIFGSQNEHLHIGTIIYA